MLECALNQKAKYEPLTGRSSRGEPIVGAAEEIPCRKEASNTTVTLPNGTIRRAEAVYYLVHEVHDGDYLDGHVVLRVMSMSGLGGVTVGYKAVI
jgi:hypothetical protein